MAQKLTPLLFLRKHFRSSGCRIDGGTGRGLTCDTHNGHLLGGLIVEGCAQPA